MPKLRPPLRWHGGKYYLADKIITLIPVHHTYVEPFGGGASVLLNKEPSPVEIYNDLNGSLTNFFAVLRDKREELVQALSLTPYSEKEFNQSLVSVGHLNNVECARVFFVRHRMSIGGRGDQFAASMHRTRRGMADVVSGYLSAIDEVLPAVAERFRSVQIVCRPAVSVVEKWDSPETFFYCDPPYLPKTRSKGAVYDCEMTESDHVELSGVLRSIKAKAIVSGYASELYARMYNDWRRIDIEMPNNAAGGKTKRRMIECLWLNFGQSDQ